MDVREELARIINEHPEICEKLLATLEEMYVAVAEIASEKK